jgi:hypothetical protein
MQDGADEVAGCGLPLRNTQIQGQDRDRDREDPVAERLEAGRLVPAGYGSPLSALDAASLVAPSRSTSQAEVGWPK